MTLWTSSQVGTPGVWDDEKQHHGCSTSTISFSPFILKFAPFCEKTNVERFCQTVFNTAANTLCIVFLFFFPCSTPSNPFFTLCSNTPLPELITACHILLGSLDLGPLQRETSSSSKNRCDRPIKMSDLLSTAARAPVGTKLAPPALPQPLWGTDGGDGSSRAAWELRLQWHISGIVAPSRIISWWAFQFQRRQCNLRRCNRPEPAESNAGIDESSWFRLKLTSDTNTIWQIRKQMVAAVYRRRSATATRHTGWWGQRVRGAQSQLSQAAGGVTAPQQVTGLSQGRVPTHYSETVIHTPHNFKPRVSPCFIAL